MKELLKSIIIGIFFGLMVYLPTLVLKDIDAVIFAIAAAFSVAGARMFSPNKRIMLGFNSLHMIDWAVVILISSIAFFAAGHESLAVRAIHFVCFGAFFIAIAISVRCPIFLFRRSSDKGGKGNHPEK